MFERWCFSLLLFHVIVNKTRHYCLLFWYKRTIGPCHKITCCFFLYKKNIYVTVVTVIVQALFSIFYVVAAFQCFSWISTLILYIFFFWNVVIIFIIEKKQSNRMKHLLKIHFIATFLLFIQRTLIILFIKLFLSLFFWCSSFRLFECFWTIPVIFDKNLVLVFLFLCCFSYTIQIIGEERRKLEWVQR